MKNLTKVLILPLFFVSILGVQSQEVSEAEAVEVTDIEQLLELVKDSATLRSEENKTRLADFNKSKQKQAKLLADARWLLKKESNREKKLTKNFEDNDSQLSDLEEQLNLKIGTLGELFGVVRQLSGDAKSTYSLSLTNLEFPSRIEFLGDLAERKALPKVPELEQLWYELLNEMNASGKISKFRSEVLDTSGNASMQDVIRIGQFNAIANSNYLRFIPEEQSLEFLSKILMARDLH